MPPPTDATFTLASNLAPKETDASLNLIRTCVGAIVSDDVNTLRSTWANLEVPMDATSAQRLVLQAWKKDIFNGLKGKTLAHGGLVSAAYVGITEQFQKFARDCNLSEAELRQDPASTLLSFVALTIDEPELLALVLSWDDSFTFTVPGASLRANARKVSKDFRDRMQAPKCADFWLAWHVGRAAKQSPNQTTARIRMVTVPKELVQVCDGIAPKRLSITFEHPAYTRPDILANDLTKTVLLVQFDPLSPTTTALDLRNRRAAAQDKLMANGHFVLETCNMRVACYDNGSTEREFESTVATIADEVGLLVANAKRVADPGHGLVVLEWEESTDLLHTHAE